MLEDEYRSSLRPGLEDCAALGNEPLLHDAKFRLEGTQVKSRAIPYVRRCRLPIALRRLSRALQHVFGREDCPVRQPKEPCCTRIEPRRTYPPKPSGGLPLPSWSFAATWSFVEGFLRAAKGSDSLVGSIPDEGLKTKAQRVCIGISTAGLTCLLKKIGVDVEGLLHVFCFGTTRMAAFDRLVWPEYSGLVLRTLAGLRPRQR